MDSTINQMLGAIEQRLERVEQMLTPGPTNTAPIERSRQVHHQRQQPWPCTECFPGMTA